MRSGAIRSRSCFLEDLIQHKDAVIDRLADFLTLDAAGFGRESIHANDSIAEQKPHIKYDDPGLLYQAIQRFVPGLWWRLVDNRHRSFAARPRVDAELEADLLSMLDLEISELERLTGRSLAHWRTPKLAVPVAERPQPFDLAG